MAKSLHMFVLMLFLLLLLPISLATKFSSSNQSLCHDDECLILFQFKESMSTYIYASSDPHAYPKVASWKLNSSDDKRDCCLWDGVECSRNGSRHHVIGLDLSSSFLYGFISSNSTLFNLIHLRRLNLAYNDFCYSQIPSAIGRLPHLTHLNLSCSYFSGQVPKEISQCTKLVSLDLSGNLLTLKSHHFRNLVRNSVETLRELLLSGVNIDSEVPHILSNSSSLRSLVLTDCRLRGEFPPTIFHLPMLQLVNVRFNSNLTGYLPEFHGNSQLKYLILEGTNFYGKIPASIGKLKHLKQLGLDSCSFSGPLPSSISNLTQLEYLNVNNNKFWGRVPSLSSLSRLRMLLLSYNQFNDMNLADWLGKLPYLSVLFLSSSNLSCEIPPSIGNQTQLIQLDLHNSSMVGQIPSLLLNLTHLLYLDLSYNEFTSTIPSLEILSNLTYLGLGYNNFDRWELPIWLGKLNKLKKLGLSQNNLYGEIPSVIFNLTQLEALDLSQNQFQGPIAPFPATMTKLTELSLAYNQLIGVTPRSLINLINLESFYFQNSNISATVELDSFVSLKKLKQLYLTGNKIMLSGINNHSLPKFTALALDLCELRVFPDFLRFQDELRELYLAENNITGLIPEWMGNMSKETLQLLSLGGNSLTGFEKHWPVLPWVGIELLILSQNKLNGSIPMPPPTILAFDFSHNELSGEIPPSICELQSLQVVDLSFNNITGSIPSCMEKISNTLLAMALRGNSLRGAIPNIFTNGVKLQMIDLSDNQLEGQLPRSLENCASLQFLDLGNNHIEDVFPFWLGALSKLQVLILRSNKFHGAIRITASEAKSKFPKLRIIDLSNNSFFGDLPLHYFQEWSEMKEPEAIAAYLGTTFIWYFVGATWKLGSSFSMHMYNKGVMTNYYKINNIFMAADLSSNRFGGNIPESIKSLYGLQSLNLSNNELTGVIPSSIGNMTQLESLDLSGNKLSGKIPQELVQLNFLEHLNLSYNNLVGPIPLGGQFNTFPNISYLGNPALCGFPLSNKCGNSIAPTVSYDEDHDFPSGVDWVVILSGVGGGLVIGLLFGNQLTTSLYYWFLRRFRHWKR